VKRWSDAGQLEEKGRVRGPITRIGPELAQVGAIGVFLKYAFLWEQE
jgi:hypothetical protein